MRGRKLVAVRTVRFSVYRFRYLSPREGTETSIGMVLKSLWCVQTPYSPSGDGNPFNSRFPRASRCSDTLLPVRGRKPLGHLLWEFVLDVQIPYSPGGDGNGTINASIFKTCCCSDLSGKLSNASFSSDTLLPARGRKPIGRIRTFPLSTVQTPYSPRGDGSSWHEVPPYPFHE